MIFQGLSVARNRLRSETAPLAILDINVAKNFKGHHFMGQSSMEFQLLLNLKTHCWKLTVKFKNLKLTIENKMILWCSKKEKFSFLVMFRLGLWLKMKFIAVAMLSWNEIMVKRLVTS